MFRPQKSLIAMVHVGPLPGTPAWRDNMTTLIRRATDEARLLSDEGADALMIENMYDRPYITRVGPEVVAAMTAIGRAIREMVRVPLGVQILAAGNTEALAVASACEASFVRVEGFVYAQIADEGLMPEAAAGQLLRYRRQIGADDIALFADIKKKHASHAITNDVDLSETAKSAEFFGADGLVVTGMGTGRPTAPEDVRTVRKSVDLPVLVGSGVTPDNLDSVWSDAEGFIVGSYFKHGGHWSNPPDPQRIRKLVAAVRQRRDA
ncbi:MAG TPA: BtpA/SgcQ family protein [Phycisphaerae bacterium]|jgi:hypothetical protein